MKRLLRTIPLLRKFFTDGNKNKFLRRKSPCFYLSMQRLSSFTNRPPQCSPKLIQRFFFILSFSLLLLVNSIRGQIVINEVGIAPTGGTDGNGGEYIELFNKSGCTQNIGCFVIVFSGTSGTDNPTGWTIKIPSGSSIPSGGYFVIGGIAGQGGVSGTGYLIGG